MIALVKLILLGNFLGIVIIVAKNRLRNPEMRIQFFEDLEMNKKRLKALNTFFSNFRKKAEEAVSKGGLSVFLTIRRLLVSLTTQLIPSIRTQGSALIRVLLPQIKTGVKAFLTLVKMTTKLVSQKIIIQARELREDLKAFEVPHAKKDFLERLEFHKPSLKAHPSPDNGIQKATNEVLPSDIPSLLTPKRLRGFQVSELFPSSLADISQIKGRLPWQGNEIDRQILEKKERSLVFAIAKNPTNPTFYKKLGKVYLQMNNLEDARNCLEYAIKLGSQDSEVKVLLQEIEKSVAR